ncbi:MAG: hypothetical protein ACOYEQ_10650, partial [Bacillota bacterium]
NEWYAKDTSKKIRAVFKSKGQSGKPLCTNPPYGYIKDPKDKLVPGWAETWPVLGPVMLLGGGCKSNFCFFSKTLEVTFTIEPGHKLVKSGCIFLS